MLKLLPNLSLGGILAGGLAIPTNDHAELEIKNSNSVDGIYGSMGVRPVINARGTVTIIGATRILPEVKDAMDSATAHYVQLDELMEGVGERLARLTGAEWGCVSSGASAAITLATMGCVTGGDPDKLWQVPDLTGMKDEVIIPHYSRTAYECAARAVGARMIEVSTPQELKMALGPRTAMILVLTGTHSEEGPLSLREISKLAKPMGVPILADAAAEGLEVPNPHLEQGADLVAYSGGKCLRGPQCAGLLLGRKDLVKAAWLSGAPHHGFARGQKVGREEIVGMLTAVEMWFKRDHEKEQRIWNDRLEHISERLSPIAGVACEIKQPGTRRSNRFPTLQVAWDMDLIPLTGYDLENLLWDLSPRIAVSGAGSFLPFPPNMRPNISINSSQLATGDANVIADELGKILSAPPGLKTSSVTAAYNVAGQWDVQMNFAASTVMQTLVIEQDGSLLNGTHYASRAARNLTGELHGNEILFRSSYTREGVRLNFEFSGIVTASRMEGKVSLGEYGAATWSAVRHGYD